MFTSFASWLRQNLIVAFFVLTFLIAWSIWLPLGLFAPEKVLLTLPGVWAPTLSALILLGLSEGRKGIRQFLKRVLCWRVGLHWYLIVLFSTVFIVYIAIGIGILFNVPAPELTLPAEVRRDGLFVALPIIFILNIFLGGPLAEDIGWRGYILPKLREKMPAFNASLVIGVVWAIWHLPFFIFPAWIEIVGNIPFHWFLLLTTSWSVLFAWVYVNTESILMPVLFHAAINTTLGTLGVLGHGDKNLIHLLLTIALTWLAAWVVVAVFGSDLKRSQAENGHVVSRPDPG